MSDSTTTVESLALDAAPVAHSPTGTRRIVVGVDGSVGSLAALRWAIQEARLRRVAVLAVMVWQQPLRAAGPYEVAHGLDPTVDIEEALNAATAVELARLRQEVALEQDVAVTFEAVEGHPAQALVLTAKDAGLLVVGSRGHGGFVGALIGSVSHHVVAHAQCPVVVVPDPGRLQDVIGP